MTERAAAPAGATIDPNRLPWYGTVERWLRIAGKVLGVTSDSGHFEANVAVVDSELATKPRYAGAIAVHESIAAN